MRRTLSSACLFVLATISFWYGLPTPARAGAPGVSFTSRPATKPLVPARSPVATGPFALALAPWAEPAGGASPTWGTPEPPRVEEAPKPGQWSTAIDPAVDLGTPRGFDAEDPGAKFAELLDPLFVESITLRVIRHF